MRSRKEREREYIGSLKGPRIVGAISAHGHNVTHLLQRLDRLRLVLGAHPTVHEKKKK